jgi:hypothetical protein
MAAEFVLKINQERLRIEDKKTGVHIEFPNRVVVNKRRGLILSLGEDEGVVRALFGNRFGSDAIETLTLFTADGTELAYEVRVIGHLTRLLNRQMGASGGLVPTKPGKGATYTVELLGYELFPRARRRSLEHAFQAYFRVRQLAVNGEELAIPVQKRELEVQVRRLLVRALPGAAAIAAFLAAPAGLRADRLVFALYILLALFLFYYGGRVLWMLAARRIVPVDYCFFMLRHLRGRASLIDEWLARTLWGKEPAR